MYNNLCNSSFKPLNSSYLLLGFLRAETYIPAASGPEGEVPDLGIPRPGEVDTLQVEGLGVNTPGR